MKWTVLLKNKWARWILLYVGADNAQHFVQRFGTKSGRTGGATTATATGVSTCMLMMAGRPLLLFPLLSRGQHLPHRSLSRLIPLRLLPT